MCYFSPLYQLQVRKQWRRMMAVMSRTLMSTWALHNIARNVFATYCHSVVTTNPPFLCPFWGLKKTRNIHGFFCMLYTRLLQTLIHSLFLLSQDVVPLYHDPWPFILNHLWPLFTSSQSHIAIIQLQWYESAWRQSDLLDRDVYWSQSMHVNHAKTQKVKAPYSAGRSWLLAYEW